MHHLIAFARRGVAVPLCLALLAATPVLAQPVNTAHVGASRAIPNSLLSIDMNRGAVIERVLTSWSAELPKAHAASFATQLNALRADELLAVSLAGSFDSVLEIMQASQRSPRASGDRAKALGEVDRDLVYTPISPCRFIETRTAYPNFGIPYYGAGQFAAGEIRNYVVGTACGLPAGVNALQAQVQGQATAGVGANLEATKGGGPFGGGITLIAANSPLFTVVSAAVPLNLGTNSVGIQVTVNTADVVMDVVGYFIPANRNGDGLRVFGAGTATPSVVNGDDNNSTGLAQAATIGGGGGTGTVPGGPELPSVTRTYAANTISGPAHASVIAGGTRNQIIDNGVSRPVFATISGGYDNRNYAYFGVVGGGLANVAGQVGSSAYGASVGGGFGNSAYRDYATVAGGAANLAGTYATVPGGDRNWAAGDFSLAAGRFASSTIDAAGTIVHHGTFIWGDSDGNGASPERFFSSANDQFAVRARGGVAFRVVSTTSAATGAGCSLPAGGAASWSCSSDRNLKESILAISPKAVLAKVSTLPLSTWQFKGTSRRHLSPMAQDFWAAFGLGENDTNITSSDVSGVALAAVQGLNQKLAHKLKEKDAELASLRRDMAAIKRKLGID